MSLLTEFEILGAGFLQRWRAYGVAEYPVGILGDKDSTTYGVGKLYVAIFTPDSWNLANSLSDDSRNQT
jgi:hypothetical protein